LRHETLGLFLCVEKNPGAVGRRYFAVYSGSNPDPAHQSPLGVPESRRPLFAPDIFFDLLEEVLNLMPVP
jgi:hypothetical protein